MGRASGAPCALRRERLAEVFFRTRAERKNRGLEIFLSAAIIFSFAAEVLPFLEVGRGGTPIRNRDSPALVAEGLSRLRMQ